VYDQTQGSGAVFLLTLQITLLFMMSRNNPENFGVFSFCHGTNVSADYTQEIQQAAHHGTMAQILCGRFKC
jgi:hypothetical protein